MTEETRAVFVANISPNATEKTVSDFFSFCGRITKLTLRKEASADGSQEAIVIFETDSAAKTALLLTNALIVDRPITVVPHVPSTIDTEPLPQQTEVPPDNITNRTFTAPDHERSKTSVMASLLAAGYVLGSDTVSQARDFDEKHMITLQLKVGAEQVKAKANEIDRALHISETANVIKTVTLEKAKEVDEKLGITDKVNQAADAVKQQANALATKAAENEVVAKGVGMMKSIGNSIQQSFQSLKDESLLLVEQKRAQEQQQQQQQAGDAPVAVSTEEVLVAVPEVLPVVDSPPVALSTQTTH
jgi:predicted RND superfamily exporter protein